MTVTHQACEDVVCAKKTCPAYATTDVCALHAPDKVISRARTIVARHFETVLETHELGSPSHESLKKLRDFILRDLEHTI